MKNSLFSFLIEKSLSRDFYILSLFICISLISCKKDGVPGTIEEPMAQIDLDYGYFQKGSYWIYQDSASLAIDSMYVKSSAKGYGWLTGNNNTPNDHYYQYDVFDQSTFDGREYHYISTTQGSYHDPSTANQWCVFLYAIPFPYPPNAIADEALVLDGHFVSGQPFLEGNSGYETVVFQKSFDSLKVANVYYKNVIWFQDGFNRTENNSVTNTYFAKYIGIIRKEILASHKVWNLIRYHVSQ